MGKRHWCNPDYPASDRGVCGMWAPGRVTGDPGKVTCGTCLKRVDEAFEPPSGEMTRAERQEVRERSYSEALKTIRDRHRDEFDEVNAEVRAQVELEIRERPVCVGCGDRARTGLTDGQCYSCSRDPDRDLRPPAGRRVPRLRVVDGG